MQRSRSLAQTRRIAASGDENVPFRIKGNTNKDPFVLYQFCCQHLFGPFCLFATWRKIV